MRRCVCIMMASSNGNIFRVTGHLCREFTGIHRSPVISSHRPVMRSFDIFFDLRLNKRPFLSQWSQCHITYPLCTAWSWWRHQMETFSALLTICSWNSPVTGEFPTQRPVTRSFNVFFDLRLNKRLSKQSWGWWFETLSRPLWRHCNDWGSDTHCATICCRSSIGWR